MAMKRSVFFTIDSLLASGMIILIVILVANFYISEQEKVNVNYASQDLVRVFSTLTVGEVSNQYVKTLISSGQITNLNYTLVEQIGDFWASDLDNLSYNFTRNLTDDIIPSRYGFSVLVNGEEIYSRSLPVKRVLVSSRKIVSGIAKAKPTEGYTARVLLSGIKSKKTSAYVYFGGYEGDGNLTKLLILSSDLISINGSYLEVNAGTDFDLYINNAYSGTYPKGSGGGSEMVADKWNISSAYFANFILGKNYISLNFTGNQSAYIGGGFLKVTYFTSSFNDTQVHGQSTYYFPGISGAINLYSSFYAPKNLSYMNMSLHYISPYQLYLSIGNTTIYESNASGVEYTVEFNNSNLSSTLNFTIMSENTMPIRLGLRDTILGSGSKADATLITDRTSSMSACDVITNCTAGLCDANPTGGCHDRRDNVAMKSDRKFIDTILSTSGNKLALVGFGTEANPVCDYYDFTSDNVSLKYRVSNYSSDWCGNTCISCGIVSATRIITEKEALYGSSEKFVINQTQFHVGDSGFGVSVTQNFFLTANKSKFLKSRLSIFGTGEDTDSGFKDCIFFNGKYMGRMCEPKDSPGWHTCYYPLKPEWYTNKTTNNVTITGGNTLGCFATSGDNDDWDFKDVSIILWEAQNSISNFTYDAYATTVTIGDNPFMAQINLTTNLTKSKIKSAMLEFEAIDVNLLYFDCVFFNGNYLGRVDYQKFNGTNVWQRAYFDVPSSWVNTGINQVNITAGTVNGCMRTAGTNDQWSFRNLNLSIISSDEYYTYDRSKSMLVMSDGGANTKIGDCGGCNSTAARNETIQKACEAKNLHGINIYTVAFGNPGATAIKTLNNTACCDDCSHFYTSNNSDELVEIYAKIAQSILNVGFQQQSLNISAGNFNKTKLFPDSYIFLNYSPQSDSQFNKLPLSFESQRFGNNITSGILTILPNTSVSEARVTSYSSDKWTDKTVVNNNVVFNLSKYGSSYIQLGDPFTVEIPTSLLNLGDNSILIGTGINSTNSTGGSADDRAVYKLLINAFADYTNVVAKSDGCSWAIDFGDGSSSVIKVPQSYSGTDICNFTSKTYDQNDALDLAVYQLLNNLDIDKDGKPDVNIESSNLDINTLTLSKVPSLWGPAIIEIRVWE